MTSFVYEPVKFLNPEKLLFASGLAAGQTVVDLGCGNGFYSLAAGKLVGEQGSIYSVDILESALATIASSARMNGLKNIKSVRADLELKEGLNQITTGSADLVLIANILHQLKNKDDLFSLAYRLLKTGGKLLVVDWNDSPSPFGPLVADRVSVEEVKKFAQSATLKFGRMVEADKYHYALSFVK